MKRILFIIAVCKIAFPSWDFSTRYHSRSTYVNTMDLGVGSYILPDLPIQIDIWGRGSVSRLGVERLEWSLQFDYSPIPFFVVSARSQHGYFWDEVALRTTLLLFGELKTPEWGGFSFFVKGGWYQRWDHFNKVVVLPVFRSSVTDRDFAIGLGVRQQFSSRLRLEAEVSTFENISVYNLNHPYAEISVFRKNIDENWEGRLFFRYHIILGFGRVGDVSIGLGLSI